MHRRFPFLRFLVSGMALATGLGTEGPCPFAHYPNEGSESIKSDDVSSHSKVDLLSRRNGVACGDLQSFVGLCWCYRR
jgi:hypothetical protein